MTWAGRLGLGLSRCFDFVNGQVPECGNSFVGVKADSAVAFKREYPVRVHDPSVSDEDLHARAVHEDADGEPSGRGVDGGLGFAAGWVDGGTPVEVGEGAAQECAGGDMPAAAAVRGILQGRRWQVRQRGPTRVRRTGRRRVTGRRGRGCLLQLRRPGGGCASRDAPALPWGRRQGGTHRPPLEADVAHDHVVAVVAVGRKGRRVVRVVPEVRPADRAAQASSSSAPDAS